MASDEPENNITHIIKRSGRRVLFDENKIVDAIWKAMEAASEGTQEDAQKVMREVVRTLNQEFSETPPTVEDVQDHVERALITKRHPAVAKGYILYRHERTKLREQKALLTGGKIDELDLPLNSLRVLEQRYLLRDNEGKIIETPTELFWRVSNAIAAAEQKFGGEQRAAARTFFRMMRDLEFLPASAILMNAGTDRQLSSCIVLPIEDDIHSIFQTLAQAVLMQKKGAGTGFSFSRIRSKSDTVGGIGGVTTGPLAFMRIYESSLRTIKQNGRRFGANMAVLRVDHPDILDFINMKLDGHTLTNFNISVGVTDAFMKAVEEDGEYELHNPRTKEVVGKLSARLVFDTILASSWRSGDPGLLFLDRINADNVCKHLGEIETTSPCAEAPMLPHECCVEGSVNLAVLVKTRRSDGKHEIDWERLRKVTRDVVWFLDNAVEVNIYYLPEIERMGKGTRHIGLGIMGFADLLYRLRIPYDSDEAASLGERIAKTIMDEAHAASVELARERGAFGFYKGSELEKQGKKRRNSTLLGLAPTGTISLIADASSGIEPNFALAYRRTLSDGRELLSINKAFEQAMQEYGISEEAVKRIVSRGTIHEEDGLPPEITTVFVTSQMIQPEGHIRIQAAFQKYVDGGISKTINFPTSASTKEIGDGMLAAWKHGCKGITIYRDGSLSAQVLTVGGGQ
jgi:ribonucleoside-diphosphate reductase alpha chain